MPRPNKYPNLKKRFTRGSWEIYWFWNYKRYTYNPGFIRPEDEVLVESELHLLAAALASSAPELTDRWKSHDGIVRYLRDRYRHEQVVDPDKATIAPQFWIDDYEPDIQSHCAQNWARTSLSALRDVDAFIPGGIGKTTPLHAHRYLESLIKKGKTPATRNRHLAACKRFFNWCVVTGRAQSNPFEKIKMMKEAAPEEIVYCTRDEMARVIDAARATGRPDWHAVAIALHTGCRREEIFRLEWRDLVREGSYLHIRKSKTGKKRLVPLVRDLRAMLAEARAGAGDSDHVVPLVGCTWANQADRLVELVRESLSCPVNPDLTGRAVEVVGKRLFIMTEAELAGLPTRKADMEAALIKMDRERREAKALAYALGGMELLRATAWDGGPWIPAERLGWNAWRHTFASLRAQAGKGLDLIAEWLGNSYAVCRRNYAQITPRDGRAEDAEI